MKFDYICKLRKKHNSSLVRINKCLDHIRSFEVDRLIGIAHDSCDDLYSDLSKYVLYEKYVKDEIPEEFKLESLLIAGQYL